MATIIDSLMVTLGLNSSNFESGAKKTKEIQKSLTEDAGKNSKERQEIDKKTGDAQTKHAKNLQENSKKSADSIRQIRNQAIGLLALFTGGIGLARFTSETISTAAGVGRLSANMGESIQTIVGWQRAFENVGGTAEEATDSLKKAAAAIGDYKAGRQSADLEGFAHAGGDITADVLDSPMKYLLAKSALIRKLISAKGEQQAFSDAASYMGMGANEFNLLKQGPQAVSAQVGSLGAGSGINEKSAKAAAETQVRFNKLKHTFEDVSRTVLISMIPVFDRLLTQFQKFGSWIQDHQGDIIKFVDVAAKQIVILAGEVNKFAEAVGGWQNVFEGLAAIKLASFIGSLTSILTLTAGIASAASLASGAIAAIAGYKLGEWINENFVNNTSFGDFIGEKGAKLMALMGSKDAQAAVSAIEKFNKEGFGQVGANQNGNLMSIPVNGASMSSPVQRSASAAAGNMMSTETNIENVNIVTQATDANGIAKEIKPAIEKRMYVPQANSGVN